MTEAPSPELRNALLRVLQEREFERVGGTQPIPLDVRVLAATNCDLRAAVDAGTFRLDLFYRLNVFPIETPSLRERPQDILLLAMYFIELREQGREEDQKHRAANRGVATSLRLAGQYSRAAECRGEGRDPV